MRIEDCIVLVQRRSLGGCIDLAFVFVREFFAPVARILAVFAIPSCGLVWGLSSVKTDMLLPSLLIFLFFATLFSGALIAAVGPQVFGVPISIRAALNSLRQRLAAFLLFSLVYRTLQVLISFCLVFPALLIIAHFGHFPEVVLLEQQEADKVIGRLNWLGKGGGYGRNLARAFMLILFWLFLSAGLLFLIDTGAALLFHAPVMPRVIPVDRNNFSPQVLSVLFDSPLFLTSLQMALWLPFPIIRVAWFFCYLDQRIRNECWDLELQFRVEAKRLEELQ